MRKALLLLALSFITLSFAPGNSMAASPPTPTADTVVDLLGGGGMGCSANSYSMECDNNPDAGLFKSLSCRVFTTFNEQVFPLYCRIVQNPSYQSTINAAAILYVTLLGVMFVTGIVPLRLGVVTGKAIKLVIVYMLVTNADMYFSVVYNTAMSIPQEIVKVMLAANTGPGGGSGSGDFFQYVDEGMAKMFDTFSPEINPETGETYRKDQLKIAVMGLALWQVGGDLVGGLFFSVVCGWIVAYISIMIRYLLAMLSMMFLLILGPLFIPTLLFDRIKFLGEEWIKMIISHIVQIVVVIAFLILVQGFFIQFYDLIKEGLNNPTIKESQQKYMVTYSKDAVGEETKTGYENPNVTKEYTDQLLKGDTFDKMPEFVFELAIMMIICFCSYLFLEKVPSFATMLSGNIRFATLFGGTAFSSRGGSEMTAKLAGQPGSTVNSKEDPIGKMFSDLTTGR